MSQICELIDYLVEKDTVCNVSLIQPVDTEKRKLQKDLKKAEIDLNRTREENAENEKRMNVQEDGRSDERQSRRQHCPKTTLCSRRSVGGVTLRIPL